MKILVIKRAKLGTKTCVQIWSRPKLNTIKLVTEAKLMSYTVTTQNTCQSWPTVSWWSAQDIQTSSCCFDVSELLCLHHLKCFCFAFIFSTSCPSPFSLPPFLWPRPQTTGLIHPLLLRYYEVFGVLPQPQPRLSKPSRSLQSYLLPA